MEDAKLREIALGHAIGLGSRNAWTVAQIMNAARDFHAFLSGADWTSAIQVSGREAQNRSTEPKTQ